MSLPTTSLPTVVFLDRATIPRHISLPALPFEHHWVEYDACEPQQVVERLLSADIVITNKVVLTREMLVQLPKLKLIAISATGTNNVDLLACRDLNIAVCNVQGYAMRSVPEHVVAMMFALRRNLIGYHNDIAAGEWQRHKQFCFFTHPIGDIAGSTMGIIGSGALGQATANLARALGMHVLFAERKGQVECRDGYTSFEQVLAQSDVLSLHCPLTDETRNIISEAELAQMKPNALLINTGRGGLVDEQALVDALKRRQIAGAGVDVFSAEPADMDNPLIANRDLPNFLLTPHVAWGSDSSIQQLATILIDNISAFMRGEAKNRVV
ncbi:MULTISPECIES: D-2-hydroxyacid dehydrogenase [Vibrio]|uniref:D-2-hydroxyacid dehydrogenase n=1 Tax=Vibrio TaxID=662 RepID=UPI00021A9883|nr:MULTISPECIES: D-2-hydroxyacid dehydrogenase [Vibrio]EGS56561.1 putative 2-hydroxyacid dehydrogenase [Vibrio paracholerae HE-09]MBW5417661.1 glycerate dehydrogenase [Vibrio cholerae]